MDGPKTSGDVSRSIPIWRKAAKLIVRTGLTVAVAGAAILAVQFGSSELERRADAAPAPDAAPLIPVSTSPVVRQDGYETRRAFVGQIEASKTASVSFELAGRLDEIFVDEGDWIKEGSTLANQDVSLLLAEQTQLLASKSAIEAQLRFAEKTVARSEELTERGFTSQAGLDEALARQDELRARISENEAALNSVSIRLAKSKIKAPFDGRVTERFVDGGEILAPGQSILEIVEVSQPKVRVGLPIDLETDDLNGASVIVGGKEYQANLVSLRPDIDGVTRTRTALFELESTEQLAFGQTAQLVLPAYVEAEGLWVPTTSLKEGVRGQWTILTVDEDNTVRMAPVEILHAESKRVYVRAALPETSRLINEGPHRVTVGQRVDPRGSI